MIYLASPYTHPYSAIREQRFQEAVCATAKLFDWGYNVFAPVVQGHPLIAFGLPAVWEFWEAYAEDHLSRCDELFILMLPGWRESVGVMAELRMARRIGMQVGYIHPEATRLPGPIHVAKDPGL